MGYHRAGFNVVGVDIVPQPRYPFAFIQDDALAYLHWLTAGSGGPYWLDDFAAIHASPPCQAYSVLKHRDRDRAHPDLVAPTRDLLMVTGLPWVMENVPGAPMVNAYTICGGGLGLGAEGRHLRRHRLFEVHGFELGLIPPCGHHGAGAVSVTGHAAEHTGRRTFGGTGGYEGSLRENRAAMGIDWMNRHELSQAIPPAYTQFIGEALLPAAAPLSAAL